MRRHHPDHQMDIPISMAVHWQLVGASIRTAFEKEDWEIAAEAIDEWVRRHDPEGVPTLTIKGYQWKSLFLPDGTLLRTIFAGKNHHCVVENDQILYNNQAVSPSGFVNAVGGIRRNAWRSTWVLRPDDKHWVLADTLRTRKSRPHARKAVRAGQEIAATAPCPARTSVAVTAAGSLPEEPDSVVEQAFQQPDSRPASHDEQQRMPLANAALSELPSADQTPARAPCARGAERRRQGHDSLLQSLRAELLLLLERMDSLDEQRRGISARTAEPHMFRARSRLES